MSRRTKLASAAVPRKSTRSVDPELTRLMQLYVDRFNRVTGDGVRELISADARLNVANRLGVVSDLFGSQLRSQHGLIVRSLPPL